MKSVPEATNALALTAKMRNTHAKVSTIRACAAFKPPSNSTASTSSNPSDIFSTFSAFSVCSPRAPPTVVLDRFSNPRRR